MRIVPTVVLNKANLCKLNKSSWLRSKESLQTVLSKSSLHSLRKSISECISNIQIVLEISLLDYDAQWTLFIGCSLEKTLH